MVHQTTVAVTGFLLSFMSVYAQEVCKEPYVEKRLLADDVRYASPFYVIALPRTTNTEQMDNENLSSSNIHFPPYKKHLVQWSPANPNTCNPNVELLLTAVVNAWILHQDVQHRKQFLLSFMVPLAEQLLTEGFKNPPVKSQTLEEYKKESKLWSTWALICLLKAKQEDANAVVMNRRKQAPKQCAKSVTFPSVKYVLPSTKFKKKIFKNGSNTFFTFTKGDIADRMGLAEAKGLTDSKCIYHDYTLKPICNVTVFILYRCFTEGSCGNIDIGITPGVDVRVVLAANPQVSSECRQETQTSLKDTMTFRGGDYILLPQKLKPQCVTKYNDSYSINYQRAVGSQEVKEEGLSDRFGQDKIGLSVGNANFKPVQSIVPQKPTPGVMNSRPGIQVNAGRTHPYTSSSSSVSSSSAGVSSSSSSGPVKGYAWSQSSFRIGSPSTLKPGYTPVQNFWGQNNGQWNAGSSQWNGQTSRPGAENHFNVWQSPIMPSKEAAKNPNNVYYHAYNWENLPPGCCKCN
ncbi:hypothetical protein J6590_041162 [Homalodisca vitripennis]|nr:hypothetical protein J6590_041162 [Homalodisca vitripennis]